MPRDLAAQLREQGGVNAEAFDTLFDEGFAVRRSGVVEQFVAVLEDLAWAFGEVVHAQRTAGMPGGG